MRARRLATTFFVFVFAAFGLFAATLLSQNYQKLEEKEQQERAALDRLDSLRMQANERENALRRLQGDKAYIEMAIRKKLGYVKEGERVFRFD